MGDIIEVFFDVETQKLFSDVENGKPEKLGVSILSLYKRKLNSALEEQEGEILSFWENELESAWKIFFEANRIIGFNSKHFDIPVLKPYAPSIFPKLPHFDIMQKVKEIIGHRISLNSLIQSTLNKAKSDIGTNAVIYWQKKDSVSLDKLKRYCEKDVILTKELYDYALINKELTFLDKWNTLRKIGVDFSYPKETSQKQSSQKSLF